MDVPEILIVIGIAVLIAELIHHWRWRHHGAHKTR